MSLLTILDCLLYLFFFLYVCIKLAGVCVLHMLVSSLDWIALFHLTLIKTGLLTSLTKLVGQCLPPRHKSQLPAFTWVLGTQSHFFVFAQQAAY